MGKQNYRVKIAHLSHLKYCADKKIKQLEHFNRCIHWNLIWDGSLATLCPSIALFLLDHSLQQK